MESSFYFQVTDSAQQRTNLLNFLLSSVADTQGIKGDEGSSAYEIALSLGFVGSEAEWIASLKGAKGDKGESYSPDAVGASTDKSLYDNELAGFSFLDIDNSLLYIKRSNATGDWFDGMLFGKGDDGDSAYTIAVANGFIGTEAQWLASLKGTKGDTGDSITDVTSSKVGKNTTVSVYVEGSLAESFVVSDGLDGAGAGDMLKSVYDTNDNGKVDTAEVAESVEWTGVQNKPTSFTPSTHNHDSLYEPKNTNIQNHISSTGNPHSVTKNQVGLENVDNTSDANKPVSTAQQTAIDLKLSLSGGTMTGAITGLRETRVALPANNIDLATGNLFTKTISELTTLTVSNALSSGNANSFILELTNGGVFALTWFSGVKWAGGTVPTLTASGVDILGFYSHDGGTTWRGLILAKDSK